MRLLAEEQIHISKLLDKYNLSDQYQLFKKRGWVYIEISGLSFAFHRKKSVQLIQGHFEDLFQYFVRIDKSAKHVDGFSGILNEFNMCLNELD